MDITNRRSQENKFALNPEEIDRIMGELAQMLSAEPVDRKDALRLRFILEEALLNYRDFCPEGTLASLRFSHSLGTFRVSLKVEGDSMDPFLEKDPSVTSVMGSLRLKCRNLEKFPSSLTFNHLRP